MLLDISIKSNRKHLKQFYIVNLTKTWLGNFLGYFSLSLGDFLTKTSGHPDCESIINNQETIVIKIHQYLICQNIQQLLPRRDRGPNLLAQPFWETQLCKK